MAQIVIGLVALRPAAPPRYEYQLKLITEGEFQADMRILGERGWQLSAARYVASEDPTNPARKLGAYDCILSRPALTAPLDLP